MAGNATAIKCQVQRGQQGNKICIPNRLRLMEVCYPTLHNSAHVKEIQHKWIYVVHQRDGGLLGFWEIYARPGGWLEMRHPGRGHDWRVKKNRKRHGSAGFFKVPSKKSRGHYSFLLTPVQLSKGAAKKFKNWPHPANYRINRVKSHWDEKYLQSIGIDGTEYSFYGNSGFDDAQEVASHHGIKGEKKEKARRYAVLIPDPFAWTEDIHLLGYQSALALYDQHQEKAAPEVFLAQLVQGLIENSQGLEKDPLGLKDKLKNKTAWAKAKERWSPPYHTHVFEHPFDSRRTLPHTVQADTNEWKKARKASYFDVLDFCLETHDLEREAFLNYANSQARELETWIKGPRYLLVEWSCMQLAQHFTKQPKEHPQGAEALALGLVHWAKISFRLSDTLYGQALLYHAYHSDIRLWGHPGLVKVLFTPEKASTTGWSVQKWWENIIPKKAPLSAYMLVLHCLGFLAADKDKGLDNFLDTVLVKQLGFRWGRPQRSAPKLWGKPARPSQTRPSRILKEPSTPLKDFEKAFGGYKIQAWFSKLPVKSLTLTVDAVNVCLALHKNLRGDAKPAATLKAALGTMTFGVDVTDFIERAKRGSLVKPALRGRRLALKTAKDVLGKVSGFVDVYMGLKTVQESAEKADEAATGGRTKKAIGHGLTAWGAGIGVAGAMLGLLFPPAIVIGLVIGTLLEVIGFGFLSAAKSKWQEAVHYSYFGKERGSKNTPHWLGGSSYGSDFEAQFKTLIGLQSGFRVKASSGDAVLGKSKVYPGLVQPETLYEFKWQMGWEGTGGTQWLLIEAKLPVAATGPKWYTVPNTRKRVRFGNEWTGEKPKVDVECYLHRDSQGRVDYFVVEPDGITGLPDKTYALFRVWPFGDRKGYRDVKVPFNEEVKVDEGPLKGGGLLNWTMYEASAINDTVDMDVR